MTVNAIMMAANQKTCRSPVMHLTEGEVGAALNGLERENLASRDDASGRVPKWRHRFQHQLLLKPASLAVLATLMLRGPQTVAELRANAAALEGPTDADGVAAALQDLADRGQPLVAQLPRGAGQKESRYAHRLCGDVAVADPSFEPAAEAPLPRGAAAETIAALEARIRILEERVAALEKHSGLA
jgi:uncharacterized protein YceH (UPF0502 family)